MREARRGKLYDSAFGTRMTGEGVYAQLLARRFELACKRLNLGGKEWDLDTSQFVKPRPHGEQLALFRGAAPPPQIFPSRAAPFGSRE